MYGGGSPSSYIQLRWVPENWNYKYNAYFAHPERTRATKLSNFQVNLAKLIWCIILNTDTRQASEKISRLWKRDSEVPQFQSLNFNDSRQNDLSTWIRHTRSLWKDKISLFSATAPRLRQVTLSLSVIILVGWNNVQLSSFFRATIKFYPRTKMKSITDKKLSPMNNFN